MRFWCFFDRNPEQDVKFKKIPDKFAEIVRSW
jgi:hypothetical protein